MMLEVRRFKLGRQKTVALLDSMKGDAGDAMTVYLPSGILNREIEPIIASAPGLSGVASDVAGLAAQSQTGAVLFWGTKHRFLIMPPVPGTEKYIASGYETSHLRSILGKDYTIALVLVRLGSYAIGICRGEKLLASKVGTGLVHSRHRQGGSSSARFARHREKQIETFLTRACGHITEIFAPYTTNIEYIAYGGAKTTILALQNQCPFLQKFKDHTLPPLLTIPDPRQAVLEEAIQQVWSSTIVEWAEGGPPEMKTGTAEES